MKKTKNVGSFAAAKLQAISRRLIAITALAAIIGFSFAALALTGCSDSGSSSPASAAGGGSTSRTYTWSDGNDYFNLKITSPSGGALAAVPADATYVYNVNGVQKSSGKASGDPSVKITLTATDNSGIIEMKIVVSGDTIAVSNVSTTIGGLVVSAGGGSLSSGGGDVYAAAYGIFTNVKWAAATDSNLPPAAALKTTAGTGITLADCVETFNELYGQEEPGTGDHGVGMTLADIKAYLKDFVDYGILTQAESNKIIGDLTTHGFVGAVKLIPSGAHADLDSFKGGSYSGVLAAIKL